MKVERFKTFIRPFMSIILFKASSTENSKGKAGRLIRNIEIKLLNEE
jgi:hypothetical protein